jgi:hypothetical protein
MSDHQRSPSSFEFQAPVALGGALDFWSAAPPSGEAVSFEAGSTVQELLIWRVDLPGDLDAASAALAAGESQVEAAQRALDAAVERLGTFVSAQAAAPSFDASSPAAALGDPEAETLALLNEIQTGVPAVSFGLGEKIVAGLDAVTQQFEEFVDALLRNVGSYAWVETRIEGRLMCRTSIGWSGDAKNLWLGTADAQTLALHQRALSVAVESRNTFIKTFVVSAQSAVKLVTLLSVPGAAVLALPTAWRFISQALTEINKRKDGAISA